MPHRFHASLLMLGLMCLPLAGCGQSDSSVAADAAAVNDQQPAGPEGAVAQYLEAARTGDAATVNALLTTLARQKTSELEVAVAPPGSDTARYEIGEARYLSENKDAAHVQSRWTEIDERGQPQSSDVTWMLKREADGWRVAGMMGQFVEDYPLVVLNFEDPMDVLNKLTLIQEEMQRREAQIRQADASRGDIRQR
jgi:hypothetical protein